jgi:hypothetical protein
MYLEFFIGVSVAGKHILTIKLLEVMDCFFVCSFYELLWSDLCSIHDCLVLFSFVALLLKF